MVSNKSRWRWWGSLPGPGRSMRLPSIRPGWWSCSPTTAHCLPLV